MNDDKYKTLFDKKTCLELLPPARANEFFEALFGDAGEGSYDITLAYAGTTGKTMLFDILLHERPGHCLACNLTQGLPEVFSRHPVVDVSGIVQKINAILGNQADTGPWSLGYTQQRSQSLHSIPLSIELT